MVLGVLYLAGVGIGLWRVDGSLPARLLVALLWPLGLAAAAVTIGGLLLAAMVLFPMIGATVLAAAGVVWWLAG